MSLGLLVKNSKVRQGKTFWRKEILVGFVDLFKICQIEVPQNFKNWKRQKHSCQIFQNISLYAKLNSRRKLSCLYSPVKKFIYASSWNLSTCMKIPAKISSLSCSKSKFDKQFPKYIGREICLPSFPLSLIFVNSFWVFLFCFLNN